MAYGSGFHMKNFMEFDCISSVLCEMYNVHFKNIVGHAGYMTRPHFMTFARHYMTHVNKDHMRSILSKCKNGGEAAYKMKTLNALLTKWMEKTTPANELICRNDNKCLMCEML
jgi:hypothetical protein